MRVIGVTTTLPEDQMRAQGPDAIRPTIAEITVDDLTGLKRAAADMDAGDSDRAASNVAAGPPDSVSS